jgi:hypothetical protein
MLERAVIGRNRVYVALALCVVTISFNVRSIVAKGGAGAPAPVAYGADVVPPAAVVPGTIQAEDFDTGASGVAYRDNTTGNEGGEYRATDVDIETTADSGGGYDVGWAFAGEWMSYTVTVGATGAYDLEFRVASASVGGTFHLEVGGVNKTGPLAVPDTGGWQTWTVVRKTGINLTAGQQLWRLVMDADGSTGAVGNFNYMRVAWAGGTVYGGVAPALPGTIQAENFDTGGAGVSFADTTTENSGGQYRATAVDIESTTDTGGGYNVGWAFASEWLTYAVTVSAAGIYDLDFRVASGGPGGTFHLEVNGVDRTGPLVVPSTGGWQTWTTIRKSSVSLAAGSQTFRLVMDANGATGAVGNFNYVRASASGTAFGGTVTVPGTIQTEDFDEGSAGVAYFDTTPTNSGGQYRSTGVDIESSADSGGGYNLGWVFAGEWLNYTVNVAAAGIYDVEVRVASGGSGGRFHIEVNGVDKTGPLTVANTGGWQTWATIRKSGVVLAAGPQIWRLVMDANGATTAIGNFNWLRVSSSTGNQPPAVTLTGPANGSTYTAPATVVLTASASDPENSLARVEFYSGPTLLRAATGSPYSFTWSSVGPGTYDLFAIAYDTAGASATSAGVTVTVQSSNQPPTVSLTAPAAGASYPAPATVSVAASATDPDGTIARVEFYAGTTWLTSDYSAPYGFSWSSVAAGTYSIRAVAYDNANASATSTASTITVSAGAPTAVAFQASADHATLVTSYELRIFTDGADPSVAAPLAISNMGKPAPDGAGDITVDRAAFFIGLAPGNYVAAIAAIGSGGSSISTGVPFTR